MDRTFGKQEMDILVTLIRRRDWVTGEELALLLGTSKKTVQQEIRKISQELNGECEIRSSQKKGYFLEYLSDRLRRRMISDLEQNENHYNMKGRTSVLALYLLFQRDYVTMDQLADTFFLSKSTVFSEIKTMKRWMERQGGIILEVSGTRGVRMVGDEMDRRFRCAGFAMPWILRKLPGPEAEWDRYERELSQIREGFGRELAAGGPRISGEDFNRACRYLAVCLLRDRMGFSLETDEKNEERTRRWGFSFSAGEMRGLKELLLLAARFQDGKEEEDDGCMAAARRLDDLKHEVGNMLSLPAEEIFPDERQLLVHLERLERRLREGKYATNYYDKELIISCPLETHVTEICCRRVYGREIPKMEQFFLTAYLAGGLERKKDEADVLLVSNQSPGLTGSLEAFVRKRLGSGIRSFQTEPAYRFEALGHELGNRDLLLTTEREISILHPEFCLLPAVVREREEEMAELALNRWRKERRSGKIRRALDRFRAPDRTAAVLKKMSGLEGILEAVGWDPGPDLSVNTVPGGLLYLCRFRRKAEPEICLYELNAPAEYNRKAIRRVLAVTWNPKWAGIYDFFLAVSVLLEENGRKEGRNLPF